MNGYQLLRQTLSHALDGSLSGLPGPVHLLGEAVELSPATKGLRDQHPDQVHLLPAADATLVGVAVGLAMSGKVAVVELADPSALVGALPQLTEALSLSQPDWPLHLVLRVPFGPDHSPLQIDALARVIPGLAVLSPSTPAELAQLLHDALCHSGPVLMLEPRSVLAASGTEGAPPDAQPSAHPSAQPLGHAKVVRSGDHATVVAHGADLGEALAAAETLADEGIEVDVLDLRSLAPVDVDTIASRVRHTGRVVVVGGDEGLLQAVQHAFLRLESPPAQVPPPVSASAIAAVVRTSVHY